MSKVNIQMRENQYFAPNDLSLILRSCRKISAKHRHINGGVDKIDVLMSGTTAYRITYSNGREKKIHQGTADKYLRGYLTPNERWAKSLDRLHTCGEMGPPCK
ncbi:MAG: hypothetical protein UR15_C0040G0006 [Parcubacteria group bacterium GW2011_GWA2_31_28]|nr:MAG: hypothetical protein UR15_C0040G0006 [Parcubacteria group bacterium GW2011_GWA2_31_28]